MLNSNARVLLAAICRLHRRSLICILFWKKIGEQMYTSYKLWEK